MALIQRYTTELSAHAGIQRHQFDDVHRDDFKRIQENDQEEKRYFHSLNNRLEELLRQLDELEKSNQQLRDELNNLISSWGIGGENRAKFLQDLDQFIRHLSEENRRKIHFQAEAKIFDEQTQLIDRVSSVFSDVFNLYRDRSQIIADLTNELEEELRKIRLRLEISENHVKSHEDDYQKELSKFRSYLNEWSQLALEKQHLLNEIQSLKERYNLRLAYNQEEINEWQRLLSRIAQESKHFYRDYLDTIKQQIQLDYEQMAKEQQRDVEIQLKTRLKQVQEKFQSGSSIDENEERRRREETQRFESRLDEQTKDFERLQNDFRILAEETQKKRRILQNFENDLRNKTRKQVEAHARLERETDLTRAEYYSLKDELDKLAYTLRFSVEEELKIYEALLNSLHRKKDERPRIQTNFVDSTTTTHFRAPPLLTESSRTFVTTRQSPTLKIDEFRSTPLLTETTKTIKQTNENLIPTIRIDPAAEKANNHWTYETVSSSTASSTHDESTDRDRSAERTNNDQTYGIQQSLFDQNRTKTTTTRTTRRFGQEADGSQFQRDSSGGRREQMIESNVPELDEKLLQSKIHITRKYKGNILIKFVDVTGRFVEIENTGNQARDLTGWYVERDVDGRRFEYTFPIYELDPHQTVRIYGNYHRRESVTDEDHQLQLIAPNFYDWGTGRRMRTELFNRDDVAKALFEQTIRD